MNNYNKYMEDTILRGQCADCSEAFPNNLTSVKSHAALKAWNKRHREKTGHTVRTAITHVRVYPADKS